VGGSGGGAALSTAQGSGGGAGGSGKAPQRASQSGGLFGWLSGAGPGAGTGALDVKVVASGNGRTGAAPQPEQGPEVAAEGRVGAQGQQQPPAVSGRVTPPANGSVRPPSAPLPPLIPGTSGSSGPLPPLAPSHSNPTTLQGMGSGTSTSVLGGQGSGPLHQQGSGAAQGGLASTNSLSSNSGQLQLPRRLSLSSAFATEGAGAASATAGHGAFSEMDLYTPLAAHLNKLWHLWELVRPQTSGIWQTACWPPTKVEAMFAFLSIVLFRQQTCIVA
jgi:hypothetical protein